MLKFFRKIRQRLLTDLPSGNVANNFSKYLIYGVGEIVLVVIGILIALQINNANEIHKQDKQEQNYLIALEEEFEYNKIMLENVMSTNTKNADAAFELITNTGPDEPQLSEIECSKLILRTISSEVVYYPSNGVLQEIISSGKLDLFKNQELKKLLSSWGGAMDKVRFQETELTKYRIALIDQWMETGNSRQSVVNSYGNLFDLTASKFKDNNRHLLMSEKFENNLTAFIFSSKFANQNYYSDLEEKIVVILQNLKAEIDR